MSKDSIIFRDLGLCDYETTYKAMRDFTLRRDTETPDEIWLLEHPRVFTSGLSAKPCDLLNTGDIPVVAIDRGGQVTYHGPGQLIAYILVDLHRHKLSVKKLVSKIEQSTIDLLMSYDIAAQRRDNAPGVYTANQKIASLGLRIKKGRSYHGLSINVNMDLTPFERIVPCGLRDITMTQLSEFVPNIDINSLKPLLVEHLSHQLGYNPETLTLYTTQQN